MAKTGPEAIAEALASLDLDKLEADAREDIKSGKKTRRPKAVATLNILEGLKRNKITPEDFMIKSVPVIPARFRPFASQGNSLIPGDANVLYKDLFDIRDAHNEEKNVFGEENSGQSRLALYDAVRSVYGYGDPVKPKTKAKEVKGFLKKLTGSTAKYSYFQRKLLSKPQDNVGRSTVIVDPELSIDEIGIPKDMALTMYSPYVQRRLKTSGLSDFDALKAIKDKTDLAMNALQKEVESRPVVYSRAPAWHMHSVLGGKAKLIDGSAIATNPFVTTGLGMDYDGDDHINRVIALVDEKIINNKTVENSYNGSLLGFDTNYYVNFDVLGIATLTKEDIIACMYKNTKVTYAGTTGYFQTIDLEDFPHGEFTNSNKKNGFDIDFYAVPQGVKVVALDEKTNKPVLADVSHWSVHRGRKLEIVTLADSTQIYTDNDPRAVYGVPEGSETGLPERFTPTEALARKVRVPLLKGQLTCNPGKFCVRMSPVEGEEVGALIKYEGELPEGTLAADYDFGQLLGIIIGDGWVRYDIKNESGFCIADLRGYNNAFVQEYIKNNIDSELRYKTYHREASSEQGYGESTQHRYRCKNVEGLAIVLKALTTNTEWREAQHTKYKCLPTWFNTAGEDFLRGLINGLMTTDGTISISNAKKKPQLLIAYSSISLRLCREIRQVLRMLNVRSSITKSKVTSAGNTFWQLTISAPYAKAANLLDNILDEKKREVYLNTPVSENTAHLMGTKVPMPDSVYIAMKDYLSFYKISGDSELLYGGGKARWDERVEEVAMTQNLSDSRKTRFISRSVATKIRHFFIERHASAMSVLDVVSKFIIPDLKTGRDYNASDHRVLNVLVEYIFSYTPYKTQYKQEMNDIKRSISTLKRISENPGERNITLKMIEKLESQFNALVGLIPAAFAEVMEATTEWYENNIVNDSIRWETIKSVEKTGVKHEGYDLTVPGYETFMSEDGIILSNTINVHVPSSVKAVKETYEKLMPSTTPFSNRSEGKIVPNLKQEQILGLYTSATSPNETSFDFDTEEEALSAIKKGQVPLDANVNIRQGVKMASVRTNEEMCNNIERKQDEFSNRREESGPVRNPSTGRWMLTERSGTRSARVMCDEDRTSKGKKPDKTS